jgi:hypothetical protein
MSECGSAGSKWNNYEKLNYDDGCAHTRRPDFHTQQPASSRHRHAPSPLQEFRPGNSRISLTSRLTARKLNGRIKKSPTKKITFYECDREKNWAPHCKNCPRIFNLFMSCVMCHACIHTLYTTCINSRYMLFIYVLYWFISFHVYLFTMCHKLKFKIHSKILMEAYIFPVIF